MTNFQTFSRHSFRNLELKTKCKELEAMLKTYTPEANQALSKMHREFEQKIEQEQKKCAQMRGELEQYLQLGQDFDDLAAKYAKTLQEIKHNEWMLQKLENSCE